MDHADKNNTAMYELYFLVFSGDLDEFWRIAVIYYFTCFNIAYY